jgi:predicted alpha/beta hydrolase
MYRKETVRTKDGYSLGVRIFLPFRSFTSVIVLVPSALLSQKDYLNFARFLQHHGFAVISFDYRGVGESAPTSLIGFDSSLEQWAKYDTDAVILYTRQKFPMSELIYIGHGIGGEISGLVPAIQFINKLVLINCSLSCNSFRYVKDKLWIGAMSFFYRMLSSVYGYFPGKKLGKQHNLPPGIMKEWLRWCENNNGLFDDYADHNYRKQRFSILAYSFSDDWRSRKKGVKALLDHFSSAQITWRHVNPEEVNEVKIGHLGFFNYEKSGNLWKEMITWMETFGPAGLGYTG